MATAHEWAEGYYRQAQADMNAARVLQGAEPSVLAMLLQMVLEKLGKAALLRGGQITQERARGTHAAAGAMMQHLARNALGCQPVTVRNSLAPLVDRLEHSQPSLALGGPHLEHPWESPAGEIQWPAQHLEVANAFRATSSTGVRLFAFTMWRHRAGCL